MAEQVTDKRYAHTLPDCGPEAWEPIEDHLKAVSKTAAEFARSLGQAGAEEWGRIAGLWHDVGKYSDEFQKMLEAANRLEAHVEQQPGRVNHSSAGAQHAMQTVSPWGRLLAYAIAGHHAGLADGQKLSKRMADHDLPPWQEHANRELLTSPTLPMPPVTLDHGCGKRASFQFALFTRMLFSCLVDADRLETERFCDRDKAEQRQSPVAITQLLPVLDAHLEELALIDPTTNVNRHRAAILQACRQAAGQPPGLFSLTVPTGGGKTLASLAFALGHARSHGQRRVIMAIPFTSIIEQTASVYREAFRSLGEGVVLEHHSNLDPENETWRNRLAAENWDAPLVVTTNVQLLESLFASRTTPCRKLHRIAGSVIILDEAQTLEVAFLRPCLDLLRELVTDYGCTVVLCTATQPALARRENFTIGLEGVREIIPQPAKLYAKMRRVQPGDLGRVTDRQLVDKLAELPSWLTIVNTKSHAAALYDRVSGDADSTPDGLFHLSTLMCAAHRTEQLDEIRYRLDNHLPCRVISTQLIEAGVDVDFPVVFRALAGIDSLAQAAGRCNREGRLPELGRLWLFEPADVKLNGRLLATAQKASEVLAMHPDPLDPQAVEQYFRLFYWEQEGSNKWDDCQVMNCFPEDPHMEFFYDFETAAQRFQLIKDDTHTIYIPYGSGARLIERLREEGPSRKLLRKLQRFTVGVRDWHYQTLLAAQDIEEMPDWGFSLLANGSLYREDRGLLVDRPGFVSPELSVV